MRAKPRMGTGALALIVACAGCGSGSSSTPTTPTPPPAASTSISIVGNRGNQSFSPNPGSAQDGMVSWRNSDGVMHRIVSNDGTFDTGNIAPGETSAARAVSAAGMNYHCSIHPGMIGSINSTSGPPPPCTGLYC